MLYKVFLAFKSVDETLASDHSSESHVEKCFHVILLCATN